MTDKIRTTGILDIESRGGPVKVCDHIKLPSAYPSERGAAEYGKRLEVYCSKCDETYAYTIKVN